MNVLRRQLDLRDQTAVDSWFQASVIGSVDYSTLVHITSVTQRYDDDQEDVIGDGVENAVVTNADSVTGMATQRPGRWRAGVFGE